MEEFHHTVQLIDRVLVAENTVALFLSKPSGFSFVPGQHLELIIPHPIETDGGRLCPHLWTGGGNKRDFSLASAPYEKELVVAMRLRDSAFKRSLARIPLGDDLLIEGPFGSFRLHADTEKPAVFIAGGIGVAPFVSILRQEAHDGFSRRITFFYSNRRPEDAAFLKELQGLSQAQSTFMFVPTMTDLKDSQQVLVGEIGRISKDMIAKYIPDRATSLYYSAGSPAMVAAMEKLLMDTGVSPENIRTEEFAGY